MNLDLYDIIIHNDYNLLIEYLNDDKIIYDLNGVDDHGMTLLNYSIKTKRCKEIILELIKNPNVDPNICNEYGYSPLHFLCDNYYNNDVNIIKILISRGDVNFNIESNILGYTPLNTAIECNFTEAVKFLLSLEDINTSKLFWNNKTIFQLSCTYGYIEIIKLLIEHKNIDLNVPFSYITSNLNREEIINLIWDKRNKINLDVGYYNYFEQKAAFICLLIIIYLDDKI